MIPEIERGSVILHCVENLLRKRLWTYRTADHRFNECSIIHI